MTPNPGVIGHLTAHKCSSWVLSLIVAAFVGIFSQNSLAQDRGRALGRESVRIEAGSNARSLAWSPDQRSLVGVTDRWLMLWDASTGALRWKIPYVPYLADNPIAFLDGGARIVVHYTKPQTVDDQSNHRNALSIIDTQSGKVIEDIQFDQSNPAIANRANTFDLSADKRTLAVVLGRGGPVIGYDTGTWSEIWRLPKVPTIFAMALDDRRDRLVLAQTTQGILQTWRRSPASKLIEFATYKADLSRLILDKNTGAAITGGDGALRSTRPPIPGHPETFVGIEDDPDTLVRAWDPATGRLLHTYSGPGRNVSGLAVSPSGKYIVAAKARSLYPQRDAYVLAWDFAGAKSIAVSSYGQGFPGAVAFSPDGQRLAISADAHIQILQLDTKLFR